MVSRLPQLSAKVSIYTHSYCDAIIFTSYELAVPPFNQRAGRVELVTTPVRRLLGNYVKQFRRLAGQSSKVGHIKFQ